MKVWIFSDSHGLHGEMTAPQVDMAIFAGDAGTFHNARRNLDGVLDFITWFESLQIEHKIWIAGNHDTSIEAGLVFPKEICKNTIYLEHEYKEVAGLKIYASPYTPWFYNWAYNVLPEDLEKTWENIPKGLDILLTHGPPLNILDEVSFDKYRAGDEELMKKLKEVKPRYHIFGHIHENYGMIMKGGTTFINAAVVDDEYRLVKKGHIIEII